MNITELVKEAHENAKNKGFYNDCFVCGGDKEIEGEECKNCGGTGEEQGRNISELLMLVVSELGEACEALRKGRKTALGAMSHFGKFEVKNYLLNFEKYIKDTFEDEIADCFIRLADLCGYLGIDIEKHILAKMEYNKSRPRKHGKEF